MDIETSLRRIVREELDAAVERIVAELRDRPAAESRAAYITVADAAEIAKVTPDTIRRWIKDGRLERYGGGRRHLVSHAELLVVLSDNIDPVKAAAVAELRLLQLEDE